jgi:hypothetical protein
MGVRTKRFAIGIVCVATAAAVLSSAAWSDLIAGDLKNDVAASVQTSATYTRDSLPMDDVSHWWIEAKDGDVINGCNADATHPVTLTISSSASGIELWNGTDYASSSVAVDVTGCSAASATTTPAVAAALPYRLPVWMPLGRTSLRGTGSGGKTDSSGRTGTYTTKTLAININPRNPSGTRAAVNVSGRPIVSWTASADEGDLTGYQIRRRTATVAYPDWTTPLGEIAATSYVDESAAGLENYCYQVRAFFRQSVNNGSGSSVVIFPSGQTAEACVTTPARDVTPPTLTLPNDLTVDATSPAGATVTYLASAVDGGAPVPIMCAPASGGVFPIGDITVACSATDAAENVAHGSFLVHVIGDTTPPSLSLPADITVDADSPAGAAVSYAASATDNASPILISCSPTSGTTFSIGTTTVNCSATDAFSNVANGSFTVHVVGDVVAPTLNLPSDMTVDAVDPSGANVSFSASATDSGHSVAVTCLPASGSKFAIGDTPVNCSATDAYGNTGAGSFTVHMLGDTVAPALALPADMTVDAVDPSGANVTFSASATDSGHSVAVTCLPASGSKFAIGDTLVNCSATDAYGNTANGSFTVHVLGDTVAPALSLPLGMTVNAVDPSGANVRFSGSATDSGHSVAVTCLPASGSKFAIGDTLVNCSATDAYGNTAHGSFTLHVNSGKEQLSNLLTGIIRDLRISSAAKAALTTRVQAVLAQFDPLNRAQKLIACAGLSLLGAYVHAQPVSVVPADHAAQIVVDTNRIRSVLAC